MDVVALLSAVLFTASTMVGTQGGNVPQQTAVRCADPWAAETLALGVQDSPTVVRLLQAIDHTDVVVSFSLGRFMDQRARTEFIRTAHGKRYVSVAVNVRQTQPDRVAALAHELQHVVEIADARDVVDETTLSHLYQRIGRLARGAARGVLRYETGAARLVETTVLDEMSTMHAHH